ncbi:MAG TPA: DUF6786 family protein [Vicinamibacteria bacterium]|nr:DUF6786 family protein [Vicinamibacteria bacterium]
MRPLFLVLAAASCRASPEPMTPFDDDVAFLKENVEVLVLSDGAARVAVVPEYQGRVMTSTSGSTSYGWLNRSAIDDGERQPHINVFGGEDRFWLGPEGGQFSIFFEEGASFDLEHWQTPEPIDWGAWTLADGDSRRATFRKAISLVNYSGTAFSLDAERTIRVLARDELDLDVPSDVNVVAFESENTITNTGEEAWAKETGLLSIWILGMFKPSPTTTVAIPFLSGPEDELGPIVNDAYFGKVPEGRLRIGDGVLYFRGDGEYRSKIGISRRRARPWMGSYDSSGGVLTLVKYTLPDDAVDYVNSMWEIQDDPFAGDVVNSYNDGPPAPGAKPLGPFYELESSSPAAALAPGESFTHVHRTYHFEGSPAALDAIARATLSVGIETIATAFE